MLTVKLYNQEGAEIGNTNLDESVYGLNIADHQQAVFETILSQRAGMRQGTQKAKTRSEVSGGGRKPWRQKGTGRARQGSIRSPQWRGGGIVFAPTPRSYDLKVNKKVVKLATKCALSEKVSENNFFVLDSLHYEEVKTKYISKLLHKLEGINLDARILVVIEDRDYDLELLSRNMTNVLLLSVAHTSTYDIMSSNQVIITEAAVKKFAEVLK